MDSSPLIAASTLAEHLGDPNWVIVDCRFSLTAPAAGRQAYERGHIPGARYADLDRDLARAPGPADGRHPLPEPAVLAATLGGWGIDGASTVVAYDDASGAIAARLWWLLRWLGHRRSLVLDGGFAAWRGAGLPEETAAPRVEPRTFPLPAAPEAATVTADDLPALQRDGALIVDVRSGERFRGEQEPIDPVAGHVPGAINRPFSANLGSDGRFKAPAELAQDFRALLDGRRPEQLVAMCGSGVTACHLVLAMTAAGLEGATLYPGSWSEWIRNPARPIKLGAEA